MLPDVDRLVVDCAPQVAPTTMAAIVKVESAGNPYAININGASRLARQPRSREEATSWAQWLIKRGYSVDMGLAQVNSASMVRLGASVTDMFDPCANIAAGANILVANYASAAQRYGSGQGALRAALSAYNTGNHRSGFANGYVAKVVAAAGADGGPGQAPPLARKRIVSEKYNPAAARVYWVKR